MHVYVHPRTLPISSAILYKVLRNDLSVSQFLWSYSPYSSFLTKHHTHNNSLCLPVVGNSKMITLHSYTYIYNKDFDNGGHMNVVLTYSEKHFGYK